MKHEFVQDGRAGVLVLFALLALPSYAVGQAAAEGYSWENSTELSFVSTGGNASSSTLGLGSTLIAKDRVNSFKVVLGGIRGETTFRTLSATGTATAFTVNETTDSELTAESYFVRGRYDRALSKTFVFSGAGWDRNTFAGVQNRYALVVGIGRTWTEGETNRFKTDLGGTYTVQKDVNPAPGVDEGFGGVRLSMDAMRKVSANATLTSTLIIDQNVEDTDDLRADWINSLTMSFSERLAFKTSLQLLYDKAPSLLPVRLFDAGGIDTGTTVLTPGENIDSILTLTMVIKM